MRASNPSRGADDSAGRRTQANHATSRRDDDRTGRCGNVCARGQADDGASRGSSDDRPGFKAGRHGSQYPDLLVER